jgi:hypothetical protein
MALREVRTQTVQMDMLGCPDQELPDQQVFQGYKEQQVGQVR